MDFGRLWRRKLKALYASILIALTITMGSVAANVSFAHSKLRHAVPAADAVLQASPAKVALEFTEAVEPQFSVIEVIDSSGGRVDEGDTHVASDNQKQLVVSLSPLPPGIYEVSWRIMSVDTHKTKGKYTFRVEK